MMNRWGALAIVFVTRTSMGFQFQSIASVGPLLMADLALSWAQIGTLIGLYMLPGAFLALPGGVLGQRLGERRTVVGSLALMVVGGVITAVAHGYAAALAGRVLAGVGAVLMNVLLAKIVADWFTSGGMSTAMAVMLTSWPVGLGLAAATLGGLATRTSWADRLRLSRSTTPAGGTYHTGRRAGAPLGMGDRARHERRLRVGLLQREPRGRHRVRPRPADGPRRLPR